MSGLSLIIGCRCTDGEGILRWCCQDHQRGALVGDFILAIAHPGNPSAPIWLVNYRANGRLCGGDATERGVPNRHSPMRKPGQRVVDVTRPADAPSRNPRACVEPNCIQSRWGTTVFSKCTFTHCRDQKGTDRLSEVGVSAAPGGLRDRSPAVWKRRAPATAYDQEGFQFLRFLHAWHQSHVFQAYVPVLATVASEPSVVPCWCMAIT